MINSWQFKIMTTGSQPLTTSFTVYRWWGQWGWWQLWWQRW